MKIVKSTFTSGIIVLKKKIENHNIILIKDLTNKQDRHSILTRNCSLNVAYPL